MLRKTRGAAIAQAHTALSGNPALGTAVTPGGAGGGLKRRVFVMCCQRKISR